MNASSDQQAVTRVLVELEKERCSAMMKGDKLRLQQLLHRELIHVHAKGQIDSYESYFESGGFKLNYTNVQRFDDLRVRVIGSCGVMTGRQLLEGVRKTSGERVRIDSHVTQVWALEDGTWRQMVFQTTPTEMSVTK